MQLTYRGIQYNSNVQAEVTLPTQTTARYRGITYSLNRAAKPTVSLNCQLRFMGATYRKTLFY
ncbi:DUF4278 domain-containing protein [Leptolyngbya sp. 7M]|uniref:DUF4278 domain-containing protein n=1 Tax=Leptolyngbya sp. 7M TaxID=2812896 RepID=UPI001B8D8A5F|nr:DUF4278 domain-containing protein [Leptolyngbya sp. 7M]QYO62743.1 DUF4278 domain-containing protein [Leptolyngbya sp. 7M]